MSLFDEKTKVISSGNELGRELMVIPLNSITGYIFRYMDICLFSGHVVKVYLMKLVVSPFPC